MKTAILRQNLKGFCYIYAHIYFFFYRQIELFINVEFYEIESKFSFKIFLLCKYFDVLFLFSCCFCLFVCFESSF